METIGINTIFGTKHIKAPKHPKNLNVKIECDVCSTKFKVTLEKNLKREDLLIVIDREFKTLIPESNGFLGLFGGSDEVAQNREIREQVVSYNSVCPSCENVEELFCVQYNPRKIVKGDFGNAYSVSYSD